MKRRTVRLMLQAFSDWLRHQMEPAGKAVLHLFEARAALVVDDIPDAGITGLDSSEGLSDASILAGMNWLLTAIRAAYPDEWAPVAIECLRIILKRNIHEIAQIAQPPDPSPTSPEQESNHGKVRR